MRPPLLPYALVNLACAALFTGCLGGGTSDDAAVDTQAPVTATNDSPSTTSAAAPDTSSDTTRGVNGDATAPVTNTVNQPPTTSAASPYTISGTARGVNAEGLVLTYDDGTRLLSGKLIEIPLPANVTTFFAPKAVAKGDYFSFEIKTQPTGMACALANNIGEVTGDMKTLQVECTTGKYIRVDSMGKDILPISNASPANWCAVRDVNTGLVWENHQTQADGEREYTNWDDETQGQVGDTHNGAPFFRNPLYGEIHFVQQSGQQNTVTHMDTMNNNKLCGFSDWRIPAISNANIRKIFPNHLTGSTTPELETLFSGTSLSLPRIDLNYFPYTGFHYFSSSPFDSNPTSVWVAAFGYSDITYMYRNGVFKSGMAHLRLVRGARILE